MTTRFDGRVAVIVGASRGIGRETAIQFAREGGDVVLAGRSAQAPPSGDGLPGTMTATAEELRHLGRSALVMKTDVTALAASRRKAPT